MTTIQFLFLTTTVLNIMLLAFSLHVYRENKRLRLRYRKAQHTLQSMKCRLDRLGSHRISKETKYIEIEKRLRGYLNFLDTLINTIPNPIYFKDENGIYRGCNQFFAERILGISRADIIGRKAQDLSAQIPQALADFYQLNERKLLLKGGLHSFETEVPCKGGFRREFLFRIAAVNDDVGRMIGSIGVMFDQTEKNRDERDKLHKEKLEGVLETAGAVCHEMNQPLQTLLGNTELALTEISPDNPAYLSLIKIDRQIERMVEITQKLQNITHYETMQYDNHNRIIDIHRASAM